jgi:MFS family permease
MSEPSSSSTEIQSPPSAWSPFRHTLFAIMWTATMVSLVGTWMNDIASGWLMAEMTNSPMWVALVQSAVSLPIFLFALPAGAMADLVDRKKVLAIMQTFSALVAFSMWWVVYTGGITPPTLLMFAFLLGTGASFIFPCWMAIIPQLVPKDKMQSAVALHSVAVNSARTIGPAIGGIVIALWGVSYPFLINACTFVVAVLGILWCWKRLVDVRPTNLPTERFFAAMRAGVRFARSSVPLQATLINAFAYFSVASVYWALLPLIARDLLNGGPELYGNLMAGLGIGALAAALIMPTLRARFGMNKMVGGATAMTSVSIAMFAVARDPWVGITAALFCGGTWIIVVASFNVAAQVALPEWVRGRGLAVLQMVYFGAFAAASFIWGRTAETIGIRGTLGIAAVLSLAIVGVLIKWRLGVTDKPDLTPSGHWIEPVVAHVEGIEKDQGPVMITMEYVVKPEDKNAFMAAMTELAQIRRRDGAYSWGVYEDTSTPGTYIETFYLESWIEHLRQHERVTKADKEIENKVHQYHQGEERPRAKHFLAPKVPGRPDTEG